MDSRAPGPYYVAGGGEQGVMGMASVELLWQSGYQVYLCAAAPLRGGDRGAGGARLERSAGRGCPATRLNRGQHRLLVSLLSSGVERLQLGR